ncbi:hypothetical protein [Candidatus Phytoplasma prunorum]|uniref:hypothetical protein n=1 Tax=Candidatus Phytoplasma prunorum TaxID=47565 RepID=UPI002FEE6C16
MAKISLTYQEKLLFTLQQIQNEFKKYQELLLKNPQGVYNDFYHDLTLECWADFHNFLQEIIAIMEIKTTGWLEFVIDLKPDICLTMIKAVLKSFTAQYPKLKLNCHAFQNDFLIPITVNSKQTYPYYFTVDFPKKFKYQILPILCELYKALGNKGLLVNPLTMNYEILKSLINSII